MTQERLTIEIDADLKNKLKSKAAANGKTMREFLTEELQSLKSEKETKAGQCVTDPLELRELSQRIMALEDRLNDFIGR